MVKRRDFKRAIELFIIFLFQHFSSIAKSFASTMFANSGVVCYSLGYKTAKQSQTKSDIDSLTNPAAKSSFRKRLHRR